MGAARLYRRWVIPTERRRMVCYATATGGVFLAAERRAMTRTIPRTMQAVRYHRPGPALHPETVPVPTVGVGEALIRITHAGVCRTELHFLRGLLNLGIAPRTLSHWWEYPGDRPAPRASPWHPWCSASSIPLSSPHRPYLSSLLPRHLVWLWHCYLMSSSRRYRCESPGPGLAGET